MTPGNDPYIGTKLGSYEIITAIGQGGMARIYKGFHAELNRYTAIKVVHWGLQEDPEFTDRFRREAQAIAILRHPNIVQIFDFGKHTSGYYMVMEFIDGSDLSVLLSQHRERKELLPRDKVIRIIRDVAAALDYAHGRGVIHRDVKPSNIMITTEGQPILTDFGLVMLPAHRSQVTLGNTFGTPHYVAPEQAISSAAAVAASDIYSLGVILYEMATGRLPFDDESPLSVALKHISEAPPPPTTINPNLSHDVESVILRTLSKDPSDRFATAGDMVSALEMSWSNTTGVVNKGRQVLPPMPAGVPAVAVVPSMTLPTSAAVAPVVAAVDLRREERQKQPPMSPPGWLISLVGIGVVLAGVWALFSFINISSPQPSATPLQETMAVAFEPPTATPTVLSPVAIVPATSTPEPPTPVSTVAQPTMTLAVTLAPSPTANPTSTSTPEPTFTPSPTLTATPTSTLTPTPVPLPTFTSTVAAEAGPLTREQLSGKILFKTDRAGLVQIYCMEPDGSNQRPFEDVSFYAQLEDELPFSSNKQEQIVVRGEGQLDLWRSNLVTGQELRITSTGKPEYDSAWSPLDNRIVYVSEETGNGDIYMLNLDGSAVERLTVNVDNFDKHPTWSPDANRIAFWSDMGFNKNRQIWMIDLATRTIRSLSDNPYNDWDPVWVR